MRKTFSTARPFAWVLSCALIVFLGCDGDAPGGGDTSSDNNQQQDGFVGSCDNDDHSDSVLAAILLSAGDSVDARMCAPSDADVFRTGTLPTATEVTSVLVHPLGITGNPRLSVLKVDDNGGSDVLRQSTGEMNFVSVFHTTGDEAKHALEASATGLTEEIDYRIGYQRISFDGGCPQDGREPNDSPALPSFMESGRTEAGVICDGDRDVFEMGGLPDSGDPSLVMVSLIYDGATNTGGFPPYKVLTVTLENAEGEPYTGEYIVTEFGPSYFFHRLDAGEKPFIVVKGYSDLSQDPAPVGVNDYIVSMDVTELGPCTDDSNEPDDRVGAAVEIQPETPVTRTLCAADSDWIDLGDQNLNFPFKNKMTIDIKRAASVGASVWFFGTLTPESPTIYLPITFTTDDASADKQIVFDIPLTGRYFLEVKGTDPTVEAPDYEVSFSVEEF